MFTAKSLFLLDRFWPLSSMFLKLPHLWFSHVIHIPVSVGRTRNKLLITSSIEAVHVNYNLMQ